MLEVLLHDRRVGVLRRKPGGNLQFAYDESYLADREAMPLSQALPLQREGLPHRACISFFGGLLPEEGVRQQVARAIGVSPSNDYALLERLGGDCAGAVTLRPAGEEKPRSPADRRAELRPLSDDELDELLRELPRRPLAADEGGEVRLSLAGAQSKLPVVYEGAAPALPVGSATPTTHILKPEPERFPGLVDNECFCMRLAHEVGLPVAPVEKARTKSGLPFLIVTRYDRDLTRAPVRRLHQEDFCQALGKLPTEKYQADGGPTVTAMMDLLTRVSAVPARDRPLLWSALIFNSLIGNCDAHGKNYSLLYDSRAPHLAPLYDLVSTVTYEELTQRLAMSIDGAHRLDELDLAAWLELAAGGHFNRRDAERLPRELAASVLARARALARDPEHDTPIVGKIVAGIEARAGRLVG